MKKYLFLIIVFHACISNSFERKVERKYLSTIERDVRVGVRLHKNGEYKKAFKKLSESAQWGMKQPQYLLAFMYLKGQYVEQSIGIGMAWLGVANEVGIKEWQDTYDSLYKKLNAKQKNYIDKKVKQYIEKYGMKTHNLACNKRQALDSRKVRVHCELRVNRRAPLYEIEKG